jgi:DNA-binding cell septation regulator SpoVG
MIRVLRLNILTGQKVKAFSDVEINDVRVNGVKLIQGEKDLYVAYPQEKSKGGDDKYYAVVVPMTQDVEEEVYRVILEAYTKRIGRT